MGQTFQPGRVFEGLQTGPAYQVQYEDQTDSIPLSGSKDLPRSLSPFTMRVVLPRILAPSGLPSGTGTTRYDVAYESVTDLSLVTGQTTGTLTGNLSRLNPQLLQSALTSAITNSAQGANIRPPGRQGRTTPGHPRPLITNETQAIATALQILNFQNAPPLLFLVNPQSMTVQHSKVAQFTERTRKGYIYQAWGDDPVKLSFSCLTGGFVAGNINNGSPVNGQSSAAVGYQYASKLNSAAYQNLMSILMLYKSGGLIRDIVGGTEAHLMVGNIAIEYDQTVYIGYMETFSYGYDAEKPNGLIQFDFDFTALEIFDTSKPSGMVLPLQNPMDMNRQGAFASGQTFYGSPTQRTFNGPPDTIQVFTKAGLPSLLPSNVTGPIQVNSSSESTIAMLAEPQTQATSTPPPTASSRLNVLGPTLDRSLLTRFGS